MARPYKIKVRLTRYGRRARHGGGWRSRLLPQGRRGVPRTRASTAGSQDAAQERVHTSLHTILHEEGGMFRLIDRISLY